MATKKSGLSPKDCDRWDTIPGVTKTTYNSPEALKFAKEYNAKKAKKSTAAKTKKKK